MKPAKIVYARQHIEYLLDKGWSFPMIRPRLIESIMAAQKWDREALHAARSPMATEAQKVYSDACSDWHSEITQLFTQLERQSGLARCTNTDDEGDRCPGYYNPAVQMERLRALCEYCLCLAEKRSPEAFGIPKPHPDPPGLDAPAAILVGPI